jgi:hypothetical protein
MNLAGVLLGLGLAVVLAACGARDDRQWMKVNQSYTAAEFRRDLAECTKKDKLDDDCMKGRGWVPVKPSKAEEEKAPREDPSSKRRL